MGASELAQNAIDTGKTIDSPRRPWSDCTVLAFGIKHFHDGSAHVAWFSLSRKTVHTQTWAGIEFENAASLNRLRDVLCDQIDSANVGSRESSGAFAHCFDRRMNFVGYIARGGARGKIHAFRKHDFFVRCGNVPRR